MNTFCYLHSQSITLFSWSLGRRSVHYSLSLADRVHDFYARDRTPGRPEGFQAEHGMQEVVSSC
jgi:hypothetical protein